VQRFEIINELIKKNNYSTYLEIGVRNPNDCYNHIVCEFKEGVDPCIEEEHPVTYKMTSDEFFKTHKKKYDIIFIDGLHIDEQVERDIINCLNSLNENGIIVLHDCNPPSLHFAREEYYDFSTHAGILWNGTVWKAIVNVRENINNIYTSVVDTDWGIGLIKKSENPNPIINKNKYFSFKKFEEKRQYYLNLITVEEFNKMYLQND